MKRNEKNERKKAAILWTIVENPVTNTTQVRELAAKRLNAAFGEKGASTHIPLFSGDFSQNVLELLTRGVVQYWSHTFKENHNSKHLVVWAPGPRVRYGKKRWPQAMIGGEVEKKAPAKVQPEEPIKRERTLADEFSDYIKEHFRPRRDDETENQYMREAGHEFRRWKANQ